MSLAPPRNALPINLRQLVQDRLEEEQYEGAMVLLDSLTGSGRYKLPSTFIRVLVALVLAEHVDRPPDSSAGMTSLNFANRDLRPSTAASVAAERLLRRMVEVDPESVLSALPPLSRRRRRSKRDRGGSRGRADLAGHASSSDDDDETDAANDEDQPTICPVIAKADELRETKDLWNMLLVRPLGASPAPIDTKRKAEEKRSANGSRTRDGKGKLAEKEQDGDEEAHERGEADGGWLGPEKLHLWSRPGAWALIDTLTEAWTSQRAAWEKDGAPKDRAFELGLAQQCGGRKTQCHAANRRKVRSVDVSTLSELEDVLDVVFAGLSYSTKPKGRMRAARGKSAQAYLVQREQIFRQTRVTRAAALLRELLMLGEAGLLDGDALARGMARRFRTLDTEGFDVLLHQSSLRWTWDSGHGLPILQRALVSYLGTSSLARAKPLPNEEVSSPTASPLTTRSGAAFGKRDYWGEKSVEASASSAHPVLLLHEGAEEWIAAEPNLATILSLMPNGARRLIEEARRAREEVGEQGPPSSRPPAEKRGPRPTSTAARLAAERRAKAPTRSERLAKLATHLDDLESAWAIERDEEGAAIPRAWNRQRAQQQQQQQRQEGVRHTGPSRAPKSSGATAVPEPRRSSRSRRSDEETPTSRKRNGGTLAGGPEGETDEEELYRPKPRQTRHAGRRTFGVDDDGEGEEHAPPSRGGVVDAPGSDGLARRAEALTLRLRAAEVDAKLRQASVKVWLFRCAVDAHLQSRQVSSAPDATAAAAAVGTETDDAAAMRRAAERLVRALGVASDEAARCVDEATKQAGASASATQARPPPTSTTTTTAAAAVVAASSSSLSSLSSLPPSSPPPPPSGRDDHRDPEVEALRDDAIRRLRRCAASLAGWHVGVRSMARRLESGALRRGDADAATPKEATGAD